MFIINRVFSPLVFFTLLLLSQPAFAGEIRQEQKCSEIGRVLVSHDSGIRPFFPLCEKGTLVVGNQLKINIICLYGKKSHWLSGGQYDIDNICPQKNKVVNRCWIKTCLRTASKIHFIRPGSSTSLNRHPRFEWGEVENAGFYEVIVTSSSNESFQGESLIPSFQYPINSSLKSGEIYQVQVIASELKGTTKLAEGTIAYRIPSVQEIQDIESDLQKIQQSPLSAAQKLEYTDAIYLSSGLIEESIRLLASYPDINSSFRILKLLGDRYGQNGMQEKAVQTYRKVIAIAPRNSEDYSSAAKLLAQVDAKASSPGE